MLKNSQIEKIWNRIYFIRALLKLRKQDNFDIYTFLENFTKFPHQWKNAYTVEENLKSILLFIITKIDKKLNIILSKF